MEPEKIKTVCLNCGATNNYPAAAESKTVVCGRCKSPLAEPGGMIDLTLREFNLLLQKSKLPLLADFYSTTCAPCHIMHPVLERLARRRRGEILVGRVNVETQNDLAAQLGIQAVPTFIIFQRGYEIARSSGAMAETDFSLWVASKT